MIENMYFLSALILSATLAVQAQNAIERYSAECQCNVQTTNRGTKAKSDYLCGDLIFEDNFDTLDLTNWDHGITLSGYGNGEFQWYRNNRANTFVRNGILNIKPGLTSNEMDITSATVDLRNEGCIDSLDNACIKKGSPTNVINPITSAALKTSKSFNYKFGRLEIRARMPRGDWLWPVISLIPKDNVYGVWPASGQVTVVESRGNSNLKLHGQSIGNDLLVSALHFGPKWDLNKYYTALYQKRGDNFTTEFHNYQVEWTPEYILFGFDDEEYGVVKNNNGDFWSRGFFDSSIKNPWINGTKMAPFDQEFYLELRLAIGGNNGYFPDNAVNAGGKPWQTASTTASTDFWNGRNSWMGTWGLDDNSDTSNLQVDYVRVWAQ